MNSSIIFTTRLDKIKLQETEHSLFDHQENHRQSNVTIKEREFLISNLLKSGGWKVMHLICNGLGYQLRPRRIKQFEE
ncbi:hypothetical protein L1987_02707 [Smallanthus sonchifolius]|uniref:Uncharacterized protein n=1 Tax=Smallanthus sonchifolius TaxID=185202 RepID=A0ACB9K8M0_9ASTR|nr:hypothetical protein L1987_02707 [Smallanthus sonchifolius]